MKQGYRLYRQIDPQLLSGIRHKVDGQMEKILYACC